MTVEQAKLPSQQKQKVKHATACLSYDTFKFNTKTTFTVQLLQVLIYMLSNILTQLPKVSRQPLLQLTKIIKPGIF